jgi:hypothetical protein
LTSTGPNKSNNQQPTKQLQKIKQNQTKSNKIKQNQTKSNKIKQNQTKSNKYFYYGQSHNMQYPQRILSTGKIKTEKILLVC